MIRSNKVKTILPCLVLILVALPLRAEPDTLSMKVCIDYALRHSPRIKGSKADRSIASADYLEAIGRLLPSASASTSAYLNIGRGVDPKTNTYTDINTFRNNYGIESSMLLFDGLSTVFALRRSRLERAISIEQVRMTRDQVRLETIEAYYQVLFTQELYRQAREDIANSARVALRTQRMYELGMKSLPDVSEVRATEASDKVTLVRRHNDYEIALLNLKAKMNYPIDRPLVIEDSLTFVDVMPSLLTAEEVYAVAVLRLPKAVIAEQKVKSSRAMYNSSIGAFFPKITLFAGYATSFSFATNETNYEPFADQLKKRRGEYIGVALSFDLFDGFRKSATFRRAKARHRAEEARREETLSEVYKDISQSILEVNAAVEEYRATEEKARHLEQAYQATLRNYEAGNASSIDLSTASSRAKEAKIERAHAYTTYLLRREWLDYYNGSVGEDEGL